MSDSFCTLPWNQLYTDPDGTVKTCCVGITKLGNLNDCSAEDILNGQKIQQIRQDILNNKWSANCIRCKTIEKMGLQSERINEVKKNPEKYQIYKDKIFQNSNKFFLRTLEYRLDNTCNLSCIYCGSTFSSIWEKIENKKIGKISGDKIKEFESWALNNLSELEELHLFGGEPLLLKQTDKIIERVPEQTIITISSNLSIPNLEKNKIFNILKTKNNVVWQVSFENIEEKFEYVRNGASWELFDKNFKILNSYPQFTVKVSGTYNILCALNLDELYQYCSQYNNIHFKWHGLVYPDELNPYRFGKEIKSKCITEIKNILNFYDYQKSDNLKTFLDGFENIIGNENFLEKLKVFLINKEKILGKTILHKNLWSELFRDDLAHDMV